MQERPDPKTPAYEKLRPREALGLFKMYMVVANLGRDSKISPQHIVDTIMPKTRAEMADMVAQIGNDQFARHDNNTKDSVLREIITRRTQETIEQLEQSGYIMKSKNTPDEYEFTNPGFAEFSKIPQP